MYMTMLSQLSKTVTLLEKENKNNNTTLDIYEWSTTDAEMKVLSAKNSKLSKIPSFKLGVCQNTAFYVLPTGRDCSFVVIFQCIQLHFPHPQISSSI